jgi:hypothetical protein
MSNIQVQDSRIKGRGVFATAPMATGSVILRIDDSVVIRPDDPVLSKLIGAEPDPCDYLPDGTVILLQEPERCINHSCDPNVYVYSVGKIRFVLAMRDIAPGEELVLDYAINQVNGDWLDCLCGSPRCRGRHQPDFFLLPATRQLEYLPYLTLSFVQAHEGKILGLLADASGSPGAGSRGAK